MNIKITIDDIVALNESLKNEKGYDICHSNGLSGFDLDLQSASDIAEILTRIINERLG